MKLIKSVLGDVLTRFDSFHIWHELKDFLTLPVGQMMESWTLQMGFPVLRVSGDPALGELTVSQSYFTADGSTKSGDAEKSWVVPILVGRAPGVRNFYLERVRILFRGEKSRRRVRIFGFPAK